MKNQILQERSAERSNQIIEWAGASPALFQHLVDFTFSNQQTLATRSSWIMDNAAERYPFLLENKNLIRRIIKEGITLTNHSIIRAITRLLTRVYIPEKDLGILVDKAFHWLEAQATPVAVKVHCMQILFNATKRLPDLKNELILVIETQLPYASAGFKSRGNKILAELAKMP